MLKNITLVCIFMNEREWNFEKQFNGKLLIFRILAGEIININIINQTNINSQFYLFSYLKNIHKLKACL